MFDRSMFDRDEALDCAGEVIASEISAIDKAQLGARLLGHPDHATEEE